MTPLCHSFPHILTYALRKRLTKDKAEDLEANAEYIRLADQYVEVPGGSNNNNYANIDLIVDIAERVGARAVWAGWGHASENPKLVEKLNASGIIFIGPPANAMRTLGDKIASTIVAQSAKVPCIDWNGTHVELSSQSRDEQGVVVIPQDVLEQAWIHDTKEGLHHANRIGYPVMIKASEGGGGKGIRKVSNGDEFESLFSQVAREVPGSPIFIMKMMSNSRHLEVQLLADQYGNAISLFGRDCSVQRRHQKIIEEAPVTAAPQEVIDAMEKAAVRLAKLAGYVNAGTVEYLYDPVTGKFSFLELNPRLQVEHPTTEMVSGVNIPAAQLQVAMGIPLSAIKDIRTLYGLNPYEFSPIDFDFAKPASFQIQRKPMPKGHVIACRITAENPEAGFKPNSGKVLELNFRSSTNVWGYFSVSSTGGIHDFADSQFGHIFSYGETRQMSRKNMIVALKELSIRGDFRTTIEYLVTLLETEDFAENKFDTAWLDGLIAGNIVVAKPEMIDVVLCGALSKALTVFEDNKQEYMRVLEKGRIPEKKLLATSSLVEFIYDGVKFRFQVVRNGPESFTINVGGSAIQVIGRVLADSGILILLNGKSHVAYIKEEAVATMLNLDGKTIALEKESDPTKMRTPSSGKLVRFLLEDGDHVKAGQNFAEIEVMKMVMALPAGAAGTVHLEKQAGVALQSGDILARLELDDPGSVKRSKPFDGSIEVGPPESIPNKPHHRFKKLHRTIELVLDGYESYDGLVQDIRSMVEILREKDLPRAELLQVLSALAGRIPSSLEQELRDILDSDWTVVNVGDKIKAFGTLLNKHVSVDDQNGYEAQVGPVREILADYGTDNHSKTHERNVISRLLDRYWMVESQFDREHNENDILDKIRLENKTDLEKVVAVAQARAKMSARNELMLNLLGQMRSDYDGESWKLAYSPILKKLATLDSQPSVKIAVRARELLIYTTLPTYGERLKEIETTLSHAMTPSAGKDAFALRSIRDVLVPGDLRELISANYSILDVLTSSFFNDTNNLRIAAFYTYIMHTYVSAYEVASAQAETVDGIPILRWDFVLREQSRQNLDGIEPGSLESVTPEPVFDPPSRSSSSTGSPGTPTSTTGFSLAQARKGVMFACPDLATVEKWLPIIVDSMGNASVAAPSLSKRTDSVSDLVSMKNMAAPNLNRGMMNSTGTLATLSARNRTSTNSKPAVSVNVVSIALDGSKIGFKDDDTLSRQLGDIVGHHRQTLLHHGIRRLTFVVHLTNGQFPKYFTYKQYLDFKEDAIIRHIEPALAYQLELRRMANFVIKPRFGDNRRIHIYLGTGRENSADSRFFVRALVQPGAMATNVRTHDFLASEGERILSDIMDALDVLNAEQSAQTDCNHIFINFIPTFQLDEEEVEKTLRNIIVRNGIRLFRLRVTDAEIRFNIQQPGGEPYALRIMISNVTGYIIKVERFRESKSPEGLWYLESRNIPPSIRHREPVYSLHPTKESLAPRRYKAHLLGTTFCYDFPNLFRQAIQARWAQLAKKNPQVNIPKKVISSTELILTNDGNLQEVRREAGANNIGMVAWLVTLFTPEAPQGRRVVVISNDITVNTGSFGPEEDLLFKKASELARRLGVPRIYLSANSGARIGLAEEVKGRFKIAWIDAADPSKGFKYIYLTQQDMTALKDPVTGVLPVFTEEIRETVDGRFETRHRITDIVGKQHGLGVENLQGSGMIAGETSAAYRDIFTITLVTARSVGIGAYLVRLGQRTVQVEGQPIILTGSSALNKVLGREVYSSNLQLGGTQIMYKNGISHLTARNDMEGISQIVRWLGYVPTVRNAPLPEVVFVPDPVERPIDFLMPSGPYDPRHFICGTESEGRWLSGFFDRDSWMETMGGWAPGVVTGRARLGGVPMGCIAVEMRTIQETWPADPGNADSTEQVITNAPQVWLPDSAFKTAQAINDFNHGEQLPLIIFANWRGFSGGQNDLLKGILKFGSYIVDALVDYKQPVFVYLIGELRGGAWVVLDPTINPDVMEMYAETNARGGVLEPEGTVEIKYRKNQIQSTMERLDEDYRRLKRSEDQEANNDLLALERKLLPVYHQVALHFADLHDKPKRMWAKGVIRDIVDWRDSRRYFYWRLKRRLYEDQIRASIQEINPELDRQGALDLIASWFSGETDAMFGNMAAMGPNLGDLPDHEAVGWFEAFKGSHKLESKLRALRNESTRKELQDLLQRDRTAVLEGMSALLARLTTEEKEKLLQVSLFSGE
jgi:acetyl-CoA carboxylase/biotin carboxylase 1